MVKQTLRQTTSAALTSHILDAMAYQTYDSYRAPGALTPAYSNYPYNDGSRTPFEDSSRYPYGDPIRGDLDAAYTGGYGQPGYSPYGANPVGAVTPYYGGGQYGGGYGGGGGGTYDDMALGGSYYPEHDLDYSGTALTRTRSRRSSSASHHRPYASSTYYDGGYRSLSSRPIKFRMKGGFRSGIYLADAMAGARLSGGDFLKWHEMSPDPRGRVYLKIRWNGYTSLTYEIPVDSYEGRVRMATLARRVARACLHFIQVNAIPVSMDRVKLYHLEEIMPGTWQPHLTIT
ncbi:hypothetical protein BD410DRAFT_780255 [Rickenella mellea]|uniref:DUF6741 domain-containing protein n=1 Tax=Rickenella mellea TaxID=50990 RepID=A0A4R5XH64_9AGAM|nr:hypothetical protein BD410DRAFT_780255 [Rickenella mellea]